MMLTRKASTTRTCRSEGFYEFTSKKSFAKNTLPTKRDVVQRMLHESHWQTKAAFEVAAQELVNVWVFCNVYPITTNAVTLRLETLAKSFKKVHSQPQNRSVSYFKLVSNFLSDADLLFDSFCKDDKQRRTLEELYKLRMTDADFAFYKDQHGPRLAKCLSVVEKLLPSDETFSRTTEYKRQEKPSTSAQEHEKMEKNSDRISQSSNSVWIF